MANMLNVYFVNIAQIFDSSKIEESVSSTWIILSRSSIFLS